MKKVNISFQMNSLEESTNFKVIGEFKNNRLIFKDPDNVMNYVILGDETLEYYKKGSVDMKFLFQMHKQTKGIYRIMGNEMHFDISTTELKIEKEKIYLKYKLYQNKDLVNENILQIIFQKQKEGN